MSRHDSRSVLVSHACLVRAGLVFCLAGRVVNWPFDNMAPFSYDLIMADPPWSFKTYSLKGKGKSADAHYECQDLDWIKSLPVGDLANKDCLLWLWATNPMLPEALDVMRAWGFKYKTAGHWSKKTKGGKQAFGTGYVLRCAGEPFLIGTIGKPKTSKSVRSVIEGPIREHSRKPEESYAAAEILIPHAKRADLFSRQQRDGWDSWGNQTELFGGANV